MKTAIYRLLLALSLLVISLAVGMAGYMWLEGYSLFDAFYMTVITISTVGFREVKPLSDPGKLFTSLYIVLNLIFFAYLVSTVTKYIFEGELNKIYKNIMTGREVSKLKNHIILCGFGRNGRRAAQELSNSKKKFVIIEKMDPSPDKAPNAKKKYNFIFGDATQDEVLRIAGIEKANTIITTLPNDSENVFITLTAKEMNPDIQVISRASDENVEKKLLRAGADHIVMPDALGGYHMAHIVTKPFIVEFVELLSGFVESDYLLEEFGYDSFRPEFRDIPLADLEIRRKTGATVLGFKNMRKGFIFNPGPHTMLTADDVMIILGREQSIKEFKKVYARFSKLTPD